MEGYVVFAFDDLDVFEGEVPIIEGVLQIHCFL